MKNLFFVLIAAAACLFSGCIVVEENYTFKKNGGGSMQYVIDMHELMEQMGALMDMSGGEAGEDPFAGAAKGFKEQSEKLKSLIGVSNVKFEEDKKGVYKIGFSFKNVKALNDALNKLMGSDDPTAYHIFFVNDGKTIKRIHSGQANLGDLSSILGDEGDAESTKMMYQSMKYKLNFKFASDVQAVYTGIEAEDGVVSDGKSLNLSTTFSEVMEKGPATLSMTAVLK